MSLRSDIEKLLAPIWVVIRATVSKAVVNLVDDTTKMQMVQVSVLKEETSKVERVQNYGFSSVPPKGSEAIVLSVNGNQDNSVAIVVDYSKGRMGNGAPEQVTMHDKDGNYVRMTADNGIEVESPNHKVTIKASGDIEIGNQNLKRLITEEFESVYNGHSHLYVSPLHPGPTIASGPPSNSVSSLQMTTKTTLE